MIHSRSADYLIASHSDRKACMTSRRDLRAAGISAAHGDEVVLERVKLSTLPARHRS
jgi:hypothetical protein